MDHDVLMMIYGAVIGVGSSIVSTLFQSWISRRERAASKARTKKEVANNIYSDYRGS